MALLLNEIEPLRQSAMADLNAASDLPALEQAKGNWTARTENSPH